MTEQRAVRADTDCQPYRFTQRDFLLLAGNGAFDDYAKAELIGGEIIVVNAQLSRHIRVQTVLFRALARACDDLEGLGDAWLEGTVDAGAGNLPEPDIFVAAELPEEGVVPASTVMLVIEVADTSLKLDLEQKVALYAAAGIPEYWVADVNGRVIHQLWAPSGEAYAERREVAFGEVVEAVAIAELRVETGGLN